MYTTDLAEILSRVEQKTFTCEACSFTSQQEGVMLRHFGANHAVSEIRNCGEHTLYRLENEDAFKAWFAHQSYYHRRQECTWHGAGWYTLETWEQPCGRSCCTDQCIKTMTAAELFERQRLELRERASELRMIRKILKENP